MARMLPNLRSHFGVEVWVDKLTREDGSIFAPVVGDPGDGDSPSCAIIDEYHEHSTDTLYQTMTTGMGARSQPLTVIITTAGSNLASPCYDKDKEVKEVLDGILPGDHIFGMIYELDPGDDWQDPTNLIKANPNIGVSVGYEYLVKKLETARTVPRQTNAIKPSTSICGCRQRRRSSAWSTGKQLKTRAFGLRISGRMNAYLRWIWRKTRLERWYSIVRQGN